MTVAGDVLESFAQLGKINLFVVEPVKTDVRVSDDGPEWLVNFVGDGRGQLTHCRHPGNVREFRPSLTQLFFSALTFNSEVQLGRNRGDQADQPFIFSSSARA
jgi:hypothetical protein